MNKNKIYKILIEITPLLFIFTGSILLSISLKLVNPAIGNGSAQFFGEPVIIPKQNNELFKWGMVLFIIGSISEIIKIIVSNFETSTKNILNYFNYEKLKIAIKNIINGLN